MFRQNLLEKVVSKSPGESSVGPRIRNGKSSRLEILQFWSKQTWHFWHL